MNTYNSTNQASSVEKRIVAFHTGRGGRFHNPGYVSFIGENPIGDFTNDLFVNFEYAYEISKHIGDRENLKALFEKAIEGDVTAKERLSNIGLDLGEEIYTDGSGNSIGLTKEEQQSGVGQINIDNDYDTTTCCYLEDCNEKELQLILDYSGWVSAEVIEYCKEKLNIEEDEGE